MAKDDNVELDTKTSASSEANCPLAASKSHSPANKPQSIWWVYMLRCADDSLYTGIATDVERRAEEHNTGNGAKYTRSHRPVIVVWRERHTSKSSALKREAAIKKLSREQKLALIVH